MNESVEHNRSENRAINGGLLANFGLAALKTGFGIFGHSEALLADGINSMSDLAYFVVVKIFVFLARKPPDKEHPFGHRQLESIAALAVGAFVITTAIALFWNSINNVYDLLATGGKSIPVSLVALWVALLTVASKLVLAAYTRRVAVQTGNGAIMALAQDHRNDIFSASGAAIGIVVSRMGYPWADPLVGALVALVVLWTGIQILRDSAADLMDTLPGDMIERQASEAALGTAGVQDVEDIFAHRFGPYLVMNITIGVDGQLSVAEGDRIATDVERALSAKIAMLRRVYVHYHPATTGGARRSPATGASAGPQPEEPTHAT